MSRSIWNLWLENVYSLTMFLFLIFVFHKREYSSVPFLKRVTWWTLVGYLFTTLLIPAFGMLSELSDFWVSHLLVPLFDIAVAINTFSLSCAPTFEVHSPSLTLIFWLIPPDWVERSVLRKSVMPFSDLFTWECQVVGLEVTVLSGVEDSIILSNLPLQVRIYTVG